MIPAWYAKSVETLGIQGTIVLKPMRMWTSSTTTIILNRIKDGISNKGQTTMVITKVTIYNTLGVCHQWSNGFELKHGILSDDENVKVKPMEISPNLNLDIAPLLYIYVLFKIYAWLVLLEYLHVSHINTHLY